MSILFEPIKLGNVQIKNRFVHSATYEAMATEIGEATGDIVKRYSKLAKGDVGLIVSGHLYVHPLGRAALPDRRPPRPVTQLENRVYRRARVLL